MQSQGLPIEHEITNTSPLVKGGRHNAKNISQPDVFDTHLEKTLAAHLQNLEKILFMDIDTAVSLASLTSTHRVANNHTKHTQCMF
jgi:hypothetical protein